MKGNVDIKKQGVGSAGESKDKLKFSMTQLPEELKNV